MTLPLPPQALDLLNSLDSKLTLNDALVDIVDVRKQPPKDAAGLGSQDLLVRGRDGKQRTITLSDFGEFEMRRGQQMYGLFIGDTAVMLYNPVTRTHLMPSDDVAGRQRGVLTKALGPLDIVQIVKSFATDPELQGGGSRALRELKSNIDKIHAERLGQKTPLHAIMKWVVGGTIAFTIGAIIYIGAAYFVKDNEAPKMGRLPPMGGTTLVNYIDQVQLNLDQTRVGADPQGGAPVCELVGSIYNRMGRKVDRLKFTGRVRGTTIAFNIEGMDKGSEVRGVVIGRHPGACLPSYKATYELTEPECILDGLVRKGCRDFIRILF